MLPKSSSTIPLDVCTDGSSTAAPTRSPPSRRPTWLDFAQSSTDPSTNTSIPVMRMASNPRKPFSGRLDVRLGQELHQRVARAAADSGMSLNRWIQHALERSVSG